MDDGLKQKTAAEEIRFDRRDAAVMLLAEIFVFNRPIWRGSGPYLKISAAAGVRSGN